VIIKKLLILIFGHYILGGTTIYLVFHKAKLDKVSKICFKKTLKFEQRFVEIRLELILMRVFKKEKQFS
jgi:hypothetical protein